MTRWARAGNTQKHKKQPEDPTPWEEFVSQRKKINESKNKHLIVESSQNLQASNSFQHQNELLSIRDDVSHKVKKSKKEKKLFKSFSFSGNITKKCVDNNEQSPSFPSTSDAFQNKLFEAETEETAPKKKKIKKEKKLLKSLSFSGNITKKCEDDSKQSSSILRTSDSLQNQNEPIKFDSGEVDKVERKKKKKGKQKLSSSDNTGKKYFDDDEHSSSFSSTLNCSLSDEIEQKKKSKLLKKKKKKKIDVNSISAPICTYTTPKKKKIVNEEKFNNAETSDYNEINQNSLTFSSPKKASLNLVTQKKVQFMERLKKKRAEQGILLLPPNVETKIYKMKKSLREKGVPGENLKEIIRRVRRKEEFKFRKTLKTCFKCRKSGHIMSECPLLNGNSEEGTGICFKCGSAEHTSHNCPVNTSDFLFAKCFICKEQGHISRSCPKNKHGIYPKGGSCNICGNINHLKKDCPTLNLKKGEEEITVGTLEGLKNVEEMDDNEPSTFIPKKPKIIKFE